MTEPEADWTSLSKVPKFENTEIEESLTHTWEITDWDSLDDRQVSPPFECGGMMWEILLFPRGNPQRGCISLYINSLGPRDGFIPGASTTKANWHVCAAFSLTMWNPDHPSVAVTQSSNHRFTPKVSDWGYNEFSVLRSVFVKTPKAAAPLITQRGPDSKLGVNISVQMDVLRDTTGVLWHDFQDYDSREATGFTGLVNQGATCYLNSLLQSLYFTRAFRNAVYRIQDSSGFTGGLQRLFYKLATSESPVDTTDLTTTFGWDSADAFMQQDVQELARVLMDRLEAKMKGTEVDGFLSKLFVGQMKSYIKCVNVPFESARSEDFWDVQLNVRGLPDVYASFRDYCAAETLEGENQYAAGEYGLQDAVKGVVFESLPPVLHLQLKRYDYDWMRDTEVKINDHYEFPLELDLSEFVENDGAWQYDLYGVLVHAGDLNAGHYYALIKPEENGGWYKYDDERVTKAALHEVLDENFGSNNGSLLRRVTSAYMLVYIRRDMTSFVLPTGEADIAPPAEIAQVLEAEKKAEDLRQHALAEQQQYITLRVLSAKKYLHHRGPGILPWSTVSLEAINEHEEPGNLKVRLGTSLQSLAKQLDAESLWLCPTPHSNHRNARARSQKIHHVPLNDSYTVDQLAEWVNSASPVIFVGPKQPQDSGGTFKLVFRKAFDGSDVIGKDVCWIDLQIPLKEALQLMPEDAVLLEDSAPTKRKVDAQLITLDIEKSGLELGLETSDMLVVVNSSMKQSVVEYYENLANRVTLSLIPVYEDEDAYSSGVSSEFGNLQSTRPEVLVTVSMRDSYDSISKKIALELDWPAEKIQLRSFPTQWHRSTLIQSSGSNVATLWSHTNSETTRVLYRKLPVTVSQYEHMREVTISWLPDGYMGQERRKTTLGKPEDSLDLHSNQLIAIWIAQDASKSRELENPTLDELTSCLKQSLEVYAAPLVDVEVEARGVENSRLCNCFHYHTDVNRTHGIPFQFALVPGEPAKATKARLNALLRRNGDSDRSLEKIKFSIVHERQHSQTYITDDAIILFDILSSTDSIGLDHPDRRRVSTQQQALHIN